MLLAQLSSRISAQLLALTPLVDGLARCERQFPERVGAWLEQGETLLRELRSPDTSELAALRTSIISAGERRSGESAASSRRAQNLAASTALMRGEELLRSRLLSAEDRLESFEGKLIEAITAAVLVGILPPQEREWSLWLADVWAALAAHQATRPITIYLAAALAPADRLVILDRILIRLTAAKLPVLDVRRGESA